MNRASYDRIAPQWAAARSEFVLRERAYLDAVLQDVREGLVLDLGCGTGRPMAEYVLARGHRVVGIDQSRGMLEVAAKRLPSDAITPASSPASPTPSPRAPVPC